MNDRGEIQMMAATWLLGAMETERVSPRYSGIDVWDPADVLDAMIEGQFCAVAAVRAARAAIERAALAIEARLRHQGRLIYAGAGTSGRLAVQDGAELMPTFSWPPERLLLLIAGGDKAMVRAVEGGGRQCRAACAIARAPFSARVLPVRPTFAWAWTKV
jgi:N-acetylmuramic acid 6-phosphate etherase